MLYSEFLTGTGAPDNKVSYIIYRGLERVYERYEDSTKSEIYKFGQLILEDLEQVVPGEIEAQVTARLKDLKCRSAGLYGKACFDVNNRQEPDKRKEAEDNEK